jgi:hypothetical protein
VFYDKKNVIAVDGNENNITIAIFKNGVLVEVIRIETGLGKIVIAYAVRRKRISKGKSSMYAGTLLPPSAFNLSSLAGIHPPYMYLCNCLLLPYFSSTHPLWVLTFKLPFSIF